MSLHIGEIILCYGQWLLEFSYFKFVFSSIWTSGSSYDTWVHTQVKCYVNVLCMFEPPGERPHQCNECGMTFVNILTLWVTREHTQVKSHFYAFSSIWTLGSSYDTWVHTQVKCYVNVLSMFEPPGERPYQCNKCGMAFVNILTLWVTREHTQVKSQFYALSGI